MESNNQALIKVMEKSVNPHIGANVDIKV
jgi:hypothetical protein